MRYYNLQYPFFVEAEDGPNDQALYHNWSRVLSLYASCALSRPNKDKLVAIGGVAQHIAEIFSQEYVAGFFRSTLHTSLCWKALSRCSRASEWRAPSWRWAAINGDFEMALKHNSADLVHIPKFDITVAYAANPYGALESAQLTLKGRIITHLVTPSSLWRTPTPP